MTIFEDPMPGGQPGEDFRAFGSPALHGDDVAFLGHGTAGTYGVFCRCSGVIQKILVEGEPVPGLPGNVVAVLSRPPTVWNGEVAFSAAYFVNNVGLREGVYVWKDGTLEAMADFMTPVPGGAPGEHFQVLTDVSNDERGVVFAGAGDQGRIGVYRLGRADGQLEVVADEDTISPDGTLFNGATAPFTRDGVTIFVAASVQSAGYYTDTGGVLSLVVPSDLLLPGGLPGEMIEFPTGPTPSTGAGHIAFQAEGNMGSFGLYGDLDGPLDVIVDKNTINPLTGISFETFSNSPPPSK